MDDPSKAPEFNRVVDHFLTTKPQHHAAPKAGPKPQAAKKKTRPSSKGRVHKSRQR